MCGLQKMQELMLSWDMARSAATPLGDRQEVPQPRLLANCIGWGCLELHPQQIHCYWQKGVY